MRPVISTVFWVAAWILGCPFSVSAQNCKPDVSTQDKISKVNVDVWTQTLSSTSFGKALMSGAELRIAVAIGRYGPRNAISLYLERDQESESTAAFESAYRGAVGRPFFLGFKNGEPLAFVVSEVNNQASVDSGVLKVKKRVTTVVMSAYIRDSDLASWRSILTSRAIESVRILLTGDVRIDRSVDEKNGKKAMDKFSCFYQMLDQRGISLSHPSQPGGERPSSMVDGSAIQSNTKGVSPAVGKYIRSGHQNDILNLNPDGSFTINQGGRSLAGSYKVQDDTLVLMSPRLKSPSIAKLKEGSVVDDEGITWERQVGQSSSAGPLTMDQLVKMIKSNLPDDIIISAIKNSDTKVRVSPDVLIDLKAAGASDTVLRALVK